MTCSLARLLCCFALVSACGVEPPVLGTHSQSPLPGGKADDQLGSDNPSEAPQSQVMQKVMHVWQQIDAQEGWGSFSGVDQVQVAYAELRQAPERGAVILLAGRTEPMHKLFEVAYDLRELGFSIYLMDHRGQGLSGRLLDDPMRGHVENFDDYVDDLHAFIEDHVKTRPHQRLFILAKSMGACIATRFAEQHGHLIDGLILSAPMFAIDFGNIPEAVAYSVAASAWLIGKGEDYAPGKGPYEPDPDEFGKYLTTHSPERYQMAVSLLQSHPELLVGGPTNRWIKEAIESTWAAKRDAHDLKLPVLILQADIDHYVHNEDQDLVCNRAEDCDIVHLDGAYHEILMEIDEIRDQALEQIEQFLKRWHTPSSAS